MLSGTFAAEEEKGAEEMKGKEERGLEERLGDRRMEYSPPSMAKSVGWMTE